MLLRSRVQLLLLCAVTALLGACDDGSGEPCLVDTDCPDFTQVCIAARCRPAGQTPEAGSPPARDGGGTQRDSGTPPQPDAGGGADMDGAVAMQDGAAAMDAAADDAGDADGGEPPPDGAAGLEDAAADAAAPACPDASGTWTIAFVNDATACGAATAGRTSTITASPAEECTFMAATSADNPAIAGTLTVDSGGTVAGTLATGSNTATSCTGNLFGDTLSVGCGSCSMSLAR